MLYSSVYLVLTLDEKVYWWKESHFLCVAKKHFLFQFWCIKFQFSVFCPVIFSAWLSLLLYPLTYFPSLIIKEEKINIPSLCFPFSSIDFLIFHLFSQNQTKHNTYLFKNSQDACHLLLHSLALKLTVHLLMLGLNKDFKRMLGEHAEFKALHLKDMLTASDGTKKVNMSCYLFSHSFLYGYALH